VRRLLALLAIIIIAVLVVPSVFSDPAISLPSADSLSVGQPEAVAAPDSSHLAAIDMSPSSLDGLGSWSRKEPKAEGPAAAPSASPAASVSAERDFAPTSGATVPGETLAGAQPAAFVGTDRPLSAAPAGAAFAPAVAGARSVDSFAVPNRDVALTFDDGPGPSTRELVDVLASRGARATFFWVGNRTDIVSATYAIGAGNEIGSHSLDHVPFSGHTAEQDIATLTQADSAIGFQTGITPRWFRAPFNRMDANAWNAVSATNHIYVHFSVNPEDFRPGLPAYLIQNNVLKQLKPGCIVELHDSPQTVKALPGLLDQMQRAGYRAVTLSELASEATGYTAW
jgi:peptidoglycan-N-acetylglucosamine deacetylase